VAFVGKLDQGKSYMINRLLRAERIKVDDKKPEYRVPEGKGCLPSSDDFWSVTGCPWRICASTDNKYHLTATYFSEEERGQMSPEDKKKSKKRI